MLVYNIIFPSIFSSISHENKKTIKIPKEVFKVIYVFLGNKITRQKWLGGFDLENCLLITIFFHIYNSILSDLENCFLNA